MYGNCVITPYLLVVLSVWKCVLDITCETEQESWVKQIVTFILCLCELLKYYNNDWLTDAKCQ